MTLTARHRVRVPGSTDPRCIRCSERTAENHGDQFCTPCMVDEIQEAVDYATSVIADAARLAEMGRDCIPDDLAATVGALTEAVK